MNRKTIGAISFLAEYGVLVLICIFMQYSSDFTFRFMFLYFMIQTVFGHYSVKTILIWEEIRILMISHASFYLGSLLLIPIIYLDFQMMIRNLIITGIMFLFDVVFARAIRILLRKQTASRVLVIGTGKDAATLETVCKTNRFTMMDIKGFIPFEEDTKSMIEGSCHPYQEMQTFISEHDINEVIIAVPEITKAALDDLMAKLRNKVRRIKYVPLANGLVTFDSRVEDFDGLLVISSSNEECHQLSKWVKRWIDIVGGFIGCILLVPLVLYVRHVNHKNGDYDPIFFVQERIGKDGKLFKIYKFRTMIPHAEEVLEKLMEQDPKIKEEYETNKKLMNDPRITKAGTFMRKKSLDEFPQLLNVLKGEMSLVGPRPYLPREKADMKDFYDSVICCKPGITGMWQSHGRSDVGFEERCEMDDYYYRNWSLWLDVTILIKTAKGVLQHEGAI